MSATQSATAAAGKAVPHPTGPVVVALTFAGTAVAFVQSMVFPIVPLLPRLLHAAPSDTAWAVTATLLAGAVATPVTGRLGDMHGKRRMLLLALAFLVAGSVICALSDSLAPFLVGRTLQGLAGGVIPLSVSLMRDVLLAEKLPAATAAMLGSAGVGGALGLPVAALISDSLDWHLLFWTAGGVGAAATVLVARLVPEPKSRTGGRFDLRGAAGLAVGLVCLLIAVSKGSDWGWRSVTTVALLATAVIVLLLWGWFELRVPAPLVDLRVTAQPQILFANLAALALGFTLFGTSLVMPQLLQLPQSTGYGLGASLVVTGLVLAPQGLVMMGVSPLTACITRSRGPKVTLMVGCTIAGVGYLLAAVMMSEVWQLILSSCVVAAGVGFAFAALPTLVMAAAPMSMTAATNSLNTLMRSIGIATFSALAGVVLAHLTVDYDGLLLPSEAGLRAVLLLAAGAAAVALTLAACIPTAGPRPGD